MNVKTWGDLFRLRQKRKVGQVGVDALVQQVVKEQDERNKKFKQADNEEEKINMRVTPARRVIPKIVKAKAIRQVREIAKRSRRPSQVSQVESEDSFAQQPATFLASRTKRRGGPERDQKSHHHHGSLPLGKSLNARQAVLHYRARLHTIPSDTWKQQLEGKWISIYSPTLLRRCVKSRSGVSWDQIHTIPSPSYLPAWIKALFEVANQKGITLRGVIPHNFRRNEQGALMFQVAPEIDSTQRVYLGPPRLHLGLQESIFSFGTRDTRSDALWCALVAEGSA